VGYCYVIWYALTFRIVCAIFIGLPLSDTWRLCRVCGPPSCSWCDIIWGSSLSSSAAKVAFPPLRDTSPQFHLYSTRSWYSMMKRLTSLRYTSFRSCIVITVLNIIHQPVFYWIHFFSEPRFCLRLHTEPTQLSLIERARLRLRRQNCDNYINITSSQIYRCYLVLVLMNHIQYNTIHTYIFRADFS
jgi:hypothetical protein